MSSEEITLKNSLKEGDLSGHSAASDPLNVMDTSMKIIKSYCLRKFQAAFTRIMYHAHSKHTLTYKDKSCLFLTGKKDHEESQKAHKTV